MISTFKQLEKYIGSYSGQGINHENQKFTGELSLTKGINNYIIHYKATGKDGELYHEEQTTIALDLSQKLGLWSVNTNNPVMLQHTLVKNELTDQTNTLIFAFGDKENKNGFREEIAFELNADGTIGYNYSWGMPHGDFDVRSKSLMSKESKKK
jgi:hypothetical protein